MKYKKIFILFISIFFLISSGNLVSSVNYYNEPSIKSLITENLPESFSWKDINGFDYTTSVKNQHPCSSCESFAMVSMIETLVQYEIGYPFDCDLSEAALFFMNNGSCSYGANFTDMLEFLMEYGVPDEGAFPYANREFETPITEVVEDWQSRTVKISNWSWIENTEESIKNALIEHGPIFAIINFSKNFYSYKSGVYYPTKNLSMLHAVAIIGYNDTGRYWIIKNSWGEGWGEKGWQKLSYDADIFITGKGTGYENITGGGTGLCYIQGVYGNLRPDVPIIKIQHPQRGYTYFKQKYWENLILRSIFRTEFRIWLNHRVLQQILFKEVKFDTRTPKIFRGTDLVVNTTGNNITMVEIYIDDVLKYASSKPSFKWYWIIDVENGNHEIKVIAYNRRGSISKDIRDVYTFK